MGKGERIAVWLVAGLLILWLLVLTLMVAGELATINALLGRSGGAEADGWGGGASVAPTATSLSPVWGASAAGPQVGVAGVQALSGTLALTVTVRSSGAGDLLYEPPLLLDDEGRVYRVGGESLEAARLAFLDLVTRGQAQAQLCFGGEPPDGARLVLVFNPGREPSDVLAPRLEAPLPLLLAPAEDLAEPETP